MALKAAPITTATARSRTLPLNKKSFNSLIILDFLSVHQILIIQEDTRFYNTYASLFSKLW